MNTCHSDLEILYFCKKKSLRNFLSGSELVLGVLHLLSRPNLVGSDLFLVGLGGGVVGLSGRIQGSRISVASGSLGSGVSTEGAAVVSGAEGAIGTNALASSSNQAALKIEFVIIH